MGLFDAATDEVEEARRENPNREHPAKKWGRRILGAATGGDGFSINMEPVPGTGPGAGTDTLGAPRHPLPPFGGPPQLGNPQQFGGPYGLQHALSGQPFDPLGGMVDSGIHGQPGGNAIPGGGGGFLGKLGSFLKDNPDLILGVAAIVDNARRQSKMDKQRQEVIDAARARRKETAPMRSQALKQLMEPVEDEVDLTDEFADASNPFARRR